jgi:HEPN domain-containing protein
MNADAQEWLAKATKDLRPAEREMSCGESANLDLVCFLCQQGVEKLAKGALIARSVTPPRTHDLVQLHRLLQSVEPTWK